MENNLKCIEFQGIKGKSIYLQSQIHPNETHSTPVLLSLIEALKEKKINGTIRILPCVNRIGFTAYNFNYKGLYDPDTGTNWNRIDFKFIPKIKEIFKYHSQNISNIEDVLYIINHLDVLLFDDKYGIKRHDMILLEPLKNALKSNFIIDLHTPEYGVEHLYCNDHSLFVDSFDNNTVIIDNTQANTFRKFLSNLFDELVLIDNQHIQSYFYNREIVTLELPSNSLLTDSYISTWTDKILNILKSNGFIIDPLSKRKTKNVNSEVYNINLLQWYYANASGILILNSQLGKKIKKGDIMMYILTVEGKKYSIRAVNDGIFLCFRDRKNILKGEWVARVLEY